MVNISRFPFFRRSEPVELPKLVDKPRFTKLSLFTKLLNRLLLPNSSLLQGDNANSYKLFRNKMLLRLRENKHFKKLPDSASLIGIALAEDEKRIEFVFASGTTEQRIRLTSEQTDDLFNFLLDDLKKEIKYLFTLSYPTDDYPVEYTSDKKFLFSLLTDFAYLTDKQTALVGLLMLQKTDSLSDLKQDFSENEDFSVMLDNVMRLLALEEHTQTFIRAAKFSFLFSPDETAEPESETLLLTKMLKTVSDAEEAINELRKQLGLPEVLKGHYISLEFNQRKLELFQKKLRSEKIVPHKIHALLQLPYEWLANTHEDPHLQDLYKILLETLYKQDKRDLLIAIVNSQDHRSRERLLQTCKKLQNITLDVNSSLGQLAKFLQPIIKDSLHKPQTPLTEAQCGELDAIFSQEEEEIRINFTVLSFKRTDAKTQENFKQQFKSLFPSTKAHFVQPCMPHAPRGP